ncbi:phytanoyl-CoA dioxygenase family protein [Henriciella litoralis]|uniref:phytanoyl-CoA dioxygenase family protein n=1 Tax=Henriciella litoralis TaxID=568102 RepID=UPI000A036EC2|nr:phytanoyl-CoA dioxygenase family protein [Henriciella litoralis]
MTNIEQAREDYDRDGVCILRGIFDRPWLDLVERAIDEALRHPGPDAERYGPAGAERFFGDLDMWTRQESFRDFILKSPAGKLAGLIMGSSTSTFFYDQMLVKEPGTQQRTPWHQDQPYWAVSGRQVCSIWLPVDSVPKDVALEFVAGSHNWGQAYNPAHFADGSPYDGTGLPELPDIEAARDNYDILSWDVEPGDCLIFQAMLVHGAPANPKAGRRRVLSTRWLGDDARYTVPKGEVAIPTTKPDLADGAPYSGALYPTVWRAGAA